MESGRNKLLTIAIPTWNRADKLKTALSWLLPQVVDNKEYIEFLISDNASTDNTLEIVNSIKDEYPEIDVIFNQQVENTGFFGNFQKCISLGTGKYFWLLSDDDFVFPSVINEILQILKCKNVGAVFLDSWTNNAEEIESFTTKYVNQKQYFNDRPFRHSLISAVIYRHTVFGDDAIFEQLRGNALIGYAVYLKAIHGFDEFAIIFGNSLLARNDMEIRFNAFEIFTVDLKKCVIENKIHYNQSIISKIMNSFLKTNTLTHFKAYKYQNKFVDSNLTEVIKGFCYYKNFWFKIVPILIVPKFIYNKLCSDSIK